MQVGSQYLFPLSKIDTHLNGYFVSATGQMFSTKQTPVGRQMTGSGVSSRYRYYTMNGQSYDGAVLFRRAQQHASFAAETSKPSDSIALANKVAGTKAGKPTQRSHAASTQLGIKGRGVVIARVAVHDGQEHLLFGSKPAIHMTEQSYTDEMVRLATEHPGTEYVALKVVKSVKTGGFTWG